MTVAKTEAATIATVLTVEIRVVIKEPILEKMATTPNRISRIVATKAIMYVTKVHFEAFLYVLRASFRTVELMAVSAEVSLMFQIEKGSK